jgi:tetratricopeptide (TPR) repeat protein
MGMRAVSLIFPVRMLGFIAVAATAVAQPPEVPLSDRDREIRERYQQSLARDPYQVQAFDRTYDTYLGGEGVDAWIETLEADTSSAAANILLGRVHARRLDTGRAVPFLEKARELGAEGAELDWLMGDVYAAAGRYADALPHLESAASDLTDLDKRTKAIRLLGDVHHRLGNRDEAIAAWERLVETSGGDAFARWDLATTYEDHSLWEEAVDAYNGIVETSANDPYAKCRALRGKAAALLRLSKSSDAIAALEEALSLASPGNWLFADLTQRLIEVYDGLGDLDGLAEYVRAQVDAAPASIEYRVLLADVYARLDRPEDAAAEYRALLERNPDYLAGYNVLVRLYEDENQTEDAAGVLRELATRFPRDPDYLRRLGALYLDAGDEAQAIAAWDEALAGEPSPERRAEVASWFAANDFPERAITEYEAAVAEKPDKFWVYRLADLKAFMNDREGALAAWQSTLDDASTAPEIAEVATLVQSYDFEEEAAALYERAIALDPAHHESRFALANLLMQAERIEDALPHFRSLAEANDSEFWQDRGERSLLRAYKTLGVLAEKQRELEAAVEESPDDVELILRLARMYTARGNHFAAIDQYQTCIELESGEPSHTEQLAETYERAGQFNKAAETYAALLEEQPSRARGYLRELMSIYERLNQHNEAIAAAERVVELAPSDAQARVQLANAYQRLRRTDDALVQYRHAIRLEPESASLHLAYGEALKDANKMSDARDAYQRLLESTDDDGVRRDCLMRLAAVHLELGTLDTLIRDHESQIRSAPNRLEHYEALAAVYSGAERPADALEALERAHDRVADEEALLRKLLNASFDAYDLRSTVKYTEALIDLSGKPDPYELVRLGRAYGDLGDMDKARATWARIRQEYPDDPDAMVAEARALLEFGLLEEAIERERAALELAPGDRRLRMNLAQHLVDAGEYDGAQEELFRMLEYAEPEPENATNAQPLPGPATPMLRSLGYGGAFSSSIIHPGAVFMSGRHGSAYHPQQWRGDVVARIVGYAQAFGDVDAVLERLERAYDENPDSVDARNDLIGAYELTQQPEDMIALAERALEDTPDDVALMERLANQYQQLQRHSDAAGLYRRMAGLDDSRRQQFLFNAMNIYAQDGESAGEVDEIRAILEEEWPDDYVIAMQSANALANDGEVEKADAIYAELRDPDARFWQPGVAPHRNLTNAQTIARVRESVEHAYAMHLERTDRTEEAAAVFESMLIKSFGDTLPQQPNMRVHIASGNGSGYNNLRNFQTAVQHLFPSLGYTRGRALDWLYQHDPDLDLDELIARMREQAEADDTAQVLDVDKLHIAALLNAERDDDAMTRVAALLDEHPRDLELYNALVILQERALDFDAIRATYDRIREALPQTRRQLDEAEIQLAVQDGSFDRASELIEDQRIAGAPTSQLFQHVQRLYHAGGVEAATEILTEWAKSGPLPMDANLVLARSEADRGNFEKAIEIGRDVWEQSKRSSGGSFGSMHHASRNMMSMLNSFYQRAGRSEEFIGEIEELCAQRPNDLTMQASLAEVYRWNGRRDDALRILEQLVEARPRSTEAQLALANTYMDTNKYSDALAIFKDLLRTRPALYQQVQHHLHRLYQQSGLRDELAELEESLLRGRTNANTLRMLAQLAMQRNDQERAIELYRRLIAVSPQEWHHRYQIAALLYTNGDKEGARKEYEAIFAGHGSNPHAHIQPHYTQQIIRTYADLDDLDAVRTLAESLGDSPQAGAAKVHLLAGIAQHEERYDDAIEIFRAAKTNPNDHQTVQAIVQLADLKGDPELALETLREAAESGRQNSHFWNQLADRYFAAGQTEKAVEAWKEACRNGNSYHDYINVFRNMMRHELDDEAETFYAEYRRIFRQPQLAQSIEDDIVRAYLERGRFETIVIEDIFDKRNRNIRNLINRIVSHGNNGANALKRATHLMEVAAENLPDEIEVIRGWAQLYSRAGQNDEAIEWWAKTVERDRATQDDWRQYASALTNAGRREEARDVYEAYIQEQPSIGRVKMILNYLDPDGDPEAYRARRDRIVAMFPESLREHARAEFAALDARAGDTTAAGKVMRARYEESPSGEAFTEYFNHVYEFGSIPDAYALLEDFGKTSAFSPRHVNTRQALHVAFRTGGPAAAQTWLNRLLNNREQHEIQQIVNEAGSIFEEHGAASRFHDCIKFRLGTDPERGWPLAYAYGSILFGAEDFDAALTFSAEWLPRAPADDAQNTLYQLVNQLREPEQLEWLDEQGAFENIDSKTLYQAQANTYHRLKDTERRDAAIEALLETITVPNDMHVVLNLSRQVGDHDTLKAFIEKHQPQSAANDPSQGHAMIPVLIEAGEFEKAFAIWEKEPERYGAGFAGQFLEEDEFEYAIKMFQFEAERRGNQPWNYQRWAEATYKSGDKEAYRGVFAKAFENMPNDQQREQLASAYSNFLHEHKLIPGILAGDSAVEDKALGAAIVYNLTSGSFRQHEDELPRLLELLPKLNVESPATQLAVAERLQQMNEREEAARWFEAAATGLDEPGPMLNAAHGLHQCGRQDFAMDIVAALMDEDAINEQSSFMVFRLLNGVEDEERAQALAERYLDSISSEGGRAFAECEWLQSQNKGDAAADIAESILDLELTPDQLTKLENWLAAADRKDAALRALSKIVTGPYPRRDRDRAARRAVELAAEIGGFTQLWPAFLHAIFIDADAARKVRAVVYDAANADNISAILESAQAAIASDPAHPGVHEILHLVNEWSESGLASDVTPLLEIEGLSKSVQDRYQSRAAVLENWQLEAHPQSPEPDSNASMAYPEPREPFASTTDSSFAGFIDLSRLMQDGTNFDTSNGLVARTTIDSPSTKTAAISFGSCHEMASVWVNGTQVFQQKRQRPFQYDQDRFEVELEQGANEFVVRLHGPGDQTAFALGILEAP